MKTILILIFLVQYIFRIPSEQIKETIIFANSTAPLDTILYDFKNDTICQTVRVVFLNKRISFNYIVKNLKQNLTYSKIGYATRQEYENLELGEDENGNAYSVDVFEYRDKECWIRFSIENERRNKLTILTTSKCSAKIATFLPLNSLGILRKIKD